MNRKILISLLGVAALSGCAGLRDTGEKFSAADGNIARLEESLKREVARLEENHRREVARLEESHQREIARLNQVQTNLNQVQTNLNQAHASLEKNT